jgi:arabinofuranosyltransferase
LKYRRWIDEPCLVAGLVFAWIQSARYRFVLDDTFISLRYSRNLVRGYGPVFNPGLAPVEGYTNFLWMLVGALHVRLTPRPEQFLLLYNVVFGLLVVVAVWREMRLRGAQAKAWAWLAVLLTACNETLHAWMGGGLETTFFMLLVTLGVGRFLREELHGAPGMWSAVPLGLALLTRPEAYLVLAVCALTRLVRAAQDGRSRRRAALWLAGIAAACVPHLFFRLLYYGEWVPNTFFVKVSGVHLASGVPYLEIFSSAFYGSWMVIGAIVVWALFDGARSRSGFSGDRAVIAAIVAGWFAYVAVAGGDYFEFRLLAPTIPLLALLIALSASDFASPAPNSDHPRAGDSRWRTALAIFVWLAITFRMLWSGSNLGFAGELFDRLRVASAAGLSRENYSEKWRPAGEWLRRFAASDERIAVPAAGIIPWISDLATLDTHGLSDREIAHRPISTRGILAHEKSATWGDVLRFRATYHVDDLEFREHAGSFPADVLLDESRILVELPNHRWMNFRAVGNAAELRRALRARGAIVARGPAEEALDAGSGNERNRIPFDAWCAATERARRHRLEASLIPLEG